MQQILQAPSPPITRARESGRSWRAPASRLPAGATPDRLRRSKSPNEGGRLDPSRLKSIPLFQSIPEEELKQAATFADEESVEPGKQLVNEGDFSWEFMAIEEGEAEVLRGGDHVAD